LLEEEMGGMSLQTAGNRKGKIAESGRGADLQIARTHAN
jgi:hypothetical protein